MSTWFMFSMSTNRFTSFIFSENGSPYLSYSFALFFIALHSIRPFSSLQQELYGLWSRFHFHFHEIRFQIGLRVFADLFDMLFQTTSNKWTHINKQQMNFLRRSRKNPRKTINTFSHEFISICFFSQTKNSLNHWIIHCFCLMTIFWYGLITTYIFTWKR